ncbi:MAG: BatA domain-containing protein, partial [Planctomycetes bacterium]|nr:BatA domain-containing protein [Planctomycetota bacterium]
MSSLFASPSMLWWAMAAAVPLIIHLLSRRRYRRVPWAAMEFLNRAVKKIRRRLRFENLLLMLLRMAVLLLLALAFANPRAPGDGLFATVSGGSRTVIVALDTSFSMEARDQLDRSSFEKAKRLGLTLVDGLDVERDAAAFVTIGSPAHLQTRLTRDVALVRQRIEETQPGFGTTEVLGALRVVAGLLSEPELDEEFPGPRTIYFLTDLQRSSFLAPVTAKAHGELQALREIDPGLEPVLRELQDLRTEVVFVDAGGVEDDIANVAVTALSQSGKPLVAGRLAVFECRVRNFGRQTVSGELQFYLDGEQTFVQRERVTDLKGVDSGVEAETEQVVRFSVQIDDAGWHHVAARWVDDVLKVDNLRRLAVPVRERMRVLAVHGGTVQPGTEKSTFYLARAFDPWHGSIETGTSIFEVEETGSIGFNSKDLSQYDLVVLSDVPELPGARTTELEDWVRAGGALLCFPGPSFEVSGRLGAGTGTVNGVFWKNGLGLMPASLASVIGGTEMSGESWRLQFDDLDHPATAYFKDLKVRAGVTRMPVYRFAEAQVDPADESVRVLASFVRPDRPGLGSYPAILERRFGDGKVVLVTTSADTSWNIYGVTPAYVPMVTEIAQFLVSEGRRENLMVGDAYPLRLPPTVSRVTVESMDEPAQERATTLVADQTATELNLRRLAKPDRIRLSWIRQEGIRDPIRDVRVVTVNVDPEESDLMRVDRNWLSSQLG